MATLDWCIEKLSNKLNITEEHRESIIAHLNNFSSYYGAEYMTGITLGLVESYIFGIQNYFTEGIMPTAYLREELSAEYSCVADSYLKDFDPPNDSKFLSGLEDGFLYGFQVAEEYIDYANNPKLNPENDRNNEVEENLELAISFFIYKLTDGAIFYNATLSPRTMSFDPIDILFGMNSINHGENYYDLPLAA